VQCTRIKRVASLTHCVAYFTGRMTLSLSESIQQPVSRILQGKIKAAIGPGLRTKSRPMSRAGR
jgi:hypothetical protein